MTLKAIKEALEDLKQKAHVMGDDGAWNLALEAKAEIAALEKAATDIGTCRAMPTPAPEARHASIQGFVLLATIAKEAE